MPRKVFAALVVCSLVATGCSDSGPKLRSFKEAAPLADQMEELAFGLTTVAHEMGSTSSTDVSQGDTTRLKQLGSIAREFVQTVKPVEAVKAVERLQEVVTKWDQSNSGNVLVAPSPADGIADVRQDAKQSSVSLYDAFQAVFERLIFVALLIDPTAREAFAPKRSPADLPPEIPITREGHVEPLLEGIAKPRMIGAASSSMTNNEL
jgi:hypothetical protein